MTRSSTSSDDISLSMSSSIIRSTTRLMISDALSGTTIATLEGSRSFGEIARASCPSFASSRREGVVLRLGQPWVNLPQASDSLYAIAALFRVSSGVGLCARVSLRGPSRR